MHPQPTHLELTSSRPTSYSSNDLQRSSEPSQTAFTPSLQPCSLEYLKLSGAMIVMMILRDTSPEAFRTFPHLLGGHVAVHVIWCQSGHTKEESLLNRCPFECFCRDIANHRTCRISQLKSSLLVREASSTSNDGESRLAWLTRYTVCEGYGT